jgi:hypothetical protein
VRWESCNSDSSPEPSAACLEEGVLGEGLGFEALVGEVAGRMPDSLWGPRMVSRLGGTRSGAPGGYGAFLQNAGVGVVGDPERCSGLVCGVPLGHGAVWGEGRMARGMTC